MAIVLGKNPQQSYVELTDKIKGLEKLVTELIQLNQAQDSEIKRIVGEYDKLYEKYEKLKADTNE